VLDELDSASLVNENAGGAGAGAGSTGLALKIELELVSPPSGFFAAPNIEIDEDNGAVPSPPRIVDPVLLVPNAPNNPCLTSPLPIAESEPESFFSPSQKGFSASLTGASGLAVRIGAGVGVGAGGGVDGKATGAGREGGGVGVGTGVTERGWVNAVEEAKKLGTPVDEVGTIVLGAGDGVGAAMRRLGAGASTGEKSGDGTGAGLGVGVRFGHWSGTVSEGPTDGPWPGAAAVAVPLVLAFVLGGHAGVCG